MEAERSELRAAGKQNCAWRTGHERSCGKWSGLARDASCKFAEEDVDL